jgi:hypothetical protein
VQPFEACFGTRIGGPVDRRHPNLARDGRGQGNGQQNAHHLVPKLRGGKGTVVLHRICHCQIHALLTETELARHYNTIEVLQGQTEMIGFLKWVKTKPPAFFEKSRISQRLKKP